MGKSAEVLDEKGVAMAPLRKRVRKYLKIQKIEDKGRALICLKGGDWRGTVADLSKLAKA
jgi:hypothetical protein